MNKKNFNTCQVQQIINQNKYVEKIKLKPLNDKNHILWVQLNQLINYYQKLKKNTNSARIKLPVKNCIAQKRLKDTTQMLKTCLLKLMIM